MQTISLPQIDSASLSNALFECLTIDKNSENRNFNNPEATLLKMGAICICLRGNGRLTINDHNYTLSQEDMVVLLPNAIVRATESSDDFLAYVVGINTEVLSHIQIGDIVKSYIDISNNPVLHISKEQVQTTIELCEMLKRKRAEEGHPFGKEICRSLLAVLCYEIHSFYRQQMPQQISTPSRKNQIFQEFLALVNDHATEHRELTFYADKLFITHKYLSSVVKKASGKSPSEWIDRTVMLYAKTLLATTDMSIQQISAHLNFANPSFFGQYFKRHEQTTPKRYRNQNK